eukprot:SAG31_NODE_494_length_14867_cov_2.833762_3_plen_1181_part_00
MDSCNTNSLLFADGPPQTRALDQMMKLDQDPGLMSRPDALVFVGSRDSAKKVNVWTGTCFADVDAEEWLHAALEKEQGSHTLVDLAFAQLSLLCQIARKHPRNQGIVRKLFGLPHLLAIVTQSKNSLSTRASSNPFRSLQVHYCTLLDTLYLDCKEHPYANNVIKSVSWHDVKESENPAQEMLDDQHTIQELTNQNSPLFYSSRDVADNDNADSMDVEVDPIAISHWETLKNFIFAYISETATSIDDEESRPIFDQKHPSDSVAFANPMHSDTDTMDVPDSAAAAPCDLFGQSLELTRAVLQLLDRLTKIGLLMSTDNRLALSLHLADLARIAPPVRERANSRETKNRTKLESLHTLCTVLETILIRDTNVKILSLLNEFGSSVDWDNVTTNTIPDILRKQQLAEGQNNIEIVQNAFDQSGAIEFGNMVTAPRRFFELNDAEERARRSLADALLGLVLNEDTGVTGAALAVLGRLHDRRNEVRECAADLVIAVSRAETRVLKSVPREMDRYFRKFTNFHNLLLDAIAHDSLPSGHETVGTICNSISGCDKALRVVLTHLQNPESRNAAANCLLDQDRVSTLFRDIQELCCTTLPEAPVSTGSNVIEAVKLHTSALIGLGWRVLAEFCRGDEARASIVHDLLQSDLSSTVDHDDGDDFNMIKHCLSSDIHQCVDCLINIFSENANFCAALGWSPENSFITNLVDCTLIDSRGQLKYNPQPVLFLRNVLMAVRQHNSCLETQKGAIGILYHTLHESGTSAVPFFTRRQSLLLDAPEDYYPKELLPRLVAAAQKGRYEREQVKVDDRSHAEERLEFHLYCISIFAYLCIGRSAAIAPIESSVKEIVRERDMLNASFVTLKGVEYSVESLEDSFTVAIEWCSCKIPFVNCLHHVFVDTVESMSANSGIHGENELLYAKLLELFNCEIVHFTKMLNDDEPHDYMTEYICSILELVNDVATLLLAEFTDSAQPAITTASVAASSDDGRRTRQSDQSKDSQSPAAFPYDVNQSSIAEERILSAMGTICTSMQKLWVNPNLRLDGAHWDLLNDTTSSLSSIFGESKHEGESKVEHQTVRTKIKQHLDGLQEIEDAQLLSTRVQHAWGQYLLVIGDIGSKVVMWPPDCPSTNSRSDVMLTNVYASPEICPADNAGENIEFLMLLQHVKVEVCIFSCCIHLQHQLADKFY